MPIQVYGMALSTCTQRVLTTLTEKGLKYELINIDLFKGEQKDPKYIEEKHPFGVVPVLIDEDGFKIYESRAICRYLEDKYRGKGTQLIPNKDAASRGLFEQAASIETSYFDPHASALVFEQVFKEQVGRGKPDQAKIASLNEQLNAKLDVYDKILAKQPYLAGQEFSLADLFHLPYGTWLVKLSEGNLFESRPNVKKWWDSITSRPSWKQVIEIK